MFNSSLNWRRKLKEDDSARHCSDVTRLKYNYEISSMRRYQYPMLKGTTYLDHGGTTLASKYLLDSFSKEMQLTLLANPHSDSLHSSASATMIAETRREILRMFNADEAHFDIVFTANATASIKLVAEGFSGSEQGFDYYYHSNSHTSLVGVRELAANHQCLTSGEKMDAWLAGRIHETKECDGERPTLFAYPAQSNMNGERLSLDWARKIRESAHHPRTYTLLDAAALVATSPLDLGNHKLAPDFVVLSFYKIFGFPDLGALVIRKASGHVFDSRRYFGGGTTEMVTCTDNPWIARKQSSLHTRLEDGTVAIRNILALNCALKTHRSLFGEPEEISKHTSWLALNLFQQLSQLRHSNGSPVCHFYNSTTSSYNKRSTQGPTLAFNIRRSNGSWIGCWHVGKTLREDGVYVRTGSLCNPAGAAQALGVDSEWMKRAFDEGFRCNTEIDVFKGLPIGMVRVTIGAMSTLEDVEVLIRSIRSHYTKNTGKMKNPGQLNSTFFDQKPFDCKKGHEKTLQHISRNYNDGLRSSYSSSYDSLMQSKGRFRRRTHSIFSGIYHNKWNRLDPWRTPSAACK